MNNMIRGISLGIAATLLWASFYPLGRLLFAVNSCEVEPLNFTFLRFAFSTLFFIPMLLKNNHRIAAFQLLSRHWRLVLLLAGIGIIAEGVLVFWALKYTTSARVSILANTSPVSTLLLSWFCGREVLNGCKISGMILGLAGIVLIFSGRGEDFFSAGSSLFIGDIMAYLSGICWSIYTVFGEKISRQYGGMICNAVLFSVSTFMIIPLIFLFGQGFHFMLSWKAWAGAFYLGVFTNALANGLWYSALKYITPGELGACGYLSGFLSFVMAMSFLGEKITWQFAVSLACILLGTVLMFRRKPFLPQSSAKSGTFGNA